MVKKNINKINCEMKNNQELVERSSKVAVKTESIILGSKPVFIVFVVADNTCNIGLVPQSVEWTQSCQQRMLTSIITRIFQQVIW